MFSARLAATVFLCCAGFCFHANAQEFRDLPALSAEPRVLLNAADSVPRSGGTAALVILDDHRYRFEADGRYVLTEHRVIQVLDADGVEAWKSIRMEWAPWQDARPKIRARVVTPDGAVHELQEKDIAEGPVSQQTDLLSDRRILLAPLPAIAAGSVIELEIVTGLEKAAFGAGTVSRITVGDTVPVADTRVVLDTPKGMQLKTAVKLLPKLKSSSRDQGERTSMIFEQSNMDALEPGAPFLPSEIAEWPYIAFSTSPAWQETARQFSAVVERQIGGSDVHPLVTETLKGAKDRASVARLLLARLHHDVRYTGVEFGESAMVPSTPADTFSRQFGDCKDKASAYVAMLRAAGIPAWLALLQTGPGYDVSPDLPGLGIFDHAIVYIPGSPDIWVDATADTFAFGFLPSADQGRLALVVRPETTGLIRIPDGPSGANLLRETREFILPEKGAASVVETSEGWGEAGAELRAEFADPEQKRVRDDVKAYASGIYSSDKVTGIETPAAKDPDSFAVRIAMDEAHAGVAEASDAAVAIPEVLVTNRLPDWFRGELPKDDEKRSEDIELPSASVTEWVYKITPAPGFRYNGGLADEDTNLGPARLTRKVELADNGTVTVQIRFDTVKKRYTAAEGEALRKALIALRDQGMAVVAFDEAGAAMIQAGKVREAIGEFDSLMKLHPAEALHHIQMSTALLAAGAGGAARKEALEAVRLEPKSAYAYYNLGFVNLHDLVGRQFKPGYDPVAAEQAYRKAIELDPENADAYKDLALLLEYDVRGIRFSPKARMKDAIAELAVMQDKFKEADVADDLLTACLEAGEYADILTRLQKLPSTPQRTGLRLAAVAASSGSAAALAEAAKLGQEERRTALDFAAQMSIGIRRYSETAGFLKAMGAPSSNEMLANMMRAGILAGLRRSEDRPVDAADPASVVRSMFDLLSATEDNSAALIALVTKEAMGGETDTASAISVAGSLRAGLGPVFAQFEQAGLPMELLRDVVASTMQFNTEDDHDGGYLIRVTTTGKRLTFFVVKQNGRFLITGSSDSLAGVGAWIGQLLDENKPATARIWLDWAREIVQQGGGDDPLSGPLFPQLWTRNEPASGVPDVRRMRNAAASLGVTAGNAAAAAQYFAKARNAAAGPAERTALDVALVQSLQYSKQFAEMLPATEALLKAYPASDTAFDFYIRALAGLGRFDDLERAALDRAKQYPGSPGPLRNAAEATEKRGDYAGARKYDEKIIASGRAEAYDWNEYAWDALFAGQADAALADSLQQNVPEDRADASVVHTMSALMAEIGKTSEAHDLALRTMDLMGLDEPNDACWYLFGRIAEQYGLNAVAREDYARIPKPGEPEMTGSVYVLSQMRLGKMPPN